MYWYFVVPLKILRSSFQNYFRLLVKFLFHRLTIYLVNLAGSGRVEKVNEYRYQYIYTQRAFLLVPRFFFLTNNLTTRPYSFWFIAIIFGLALPLRICSSLQVLDLQCHYCVVSIFLALIRSRLGTNEKNSPGACRSYFQSPTFFTFCNSLYLIIPEKNFDTVTIRGKV